MSLQFVKKTKFLKNLIFKIWLWDAKQKLSLIQKYFSKSDRLLDIGTGPGSVCLLLRKNGFDVTPIDIQDLSLTNEVRPEIYDAKRIPFKRGDFDNVLILTVLHHSRDPVEVIMEAKRISKNLIIIEDIYQNSFQKYLTYIADSIANFEFIGHPHSNKSDVDWKKIFKKLGLKLKDAQYKCFLLFFRQAIYYLEK